MTGEEYQNGQVILIDKPLNWTSFQVVNKLRWMIRQRYNLKKIKVGHAGTLDPLATGLLVICTGKFTKKIDSYQIQHKEYTGTITIGATTPSYDLETEIDERFDISHITHEIIEAARLQFIGDIEQKPPIFSAIKKEGKRLYEYARKGELVEIPSRKVHISEFKILQLDLPNIDFRVSCSKGTYIRSLANDFGRELSNGAHLSALRRTKIGDFSVKDSITLEAFEQALTD